MLVLRLLDKLILTSVVSLLLMSGIGVTQANAAPVDQAGPPSGPLTGYVGVGRLHIRSGAGTGYPVVAVAHFKEVLSLTGRNAATSWLQLRQSNGQEGWASAAFIVASAAISQPYRSLMMGGHTRSPSFHPTNRSGRWCLTGSTYVPAPAGTKAW